MLKLLTLTWMEVNNTAFNQGRLCNVGFWEAIQEEDWDCVFFHDVNLLPDDCNLYTCDFIPAHVSVAINKFNYKLPHPGHLGGVFAVHPTHYLKINGFSNMYWGWDDEDDITARWGAGAAGPDMMRQTLPYAGGGRPWPQAEALEVNQCWKWGGWFWVLPEAHMTAPPHPLGLAFCPRSANPPIPRSSNDGINSLGYRLLSKERLPLYTNLTVDITSKPQETQCQAEGYLIWKPEQSP
ncbi:beta-1,4-galactosyltransferase 3-like isoform X1 [Pongo pygmaeus]|uniref:beta-1,4-galactosyltransferase 3-like isoform X1 n=1 Tax=Pongo pygmaeus TaxID=9600 RepID=UPI0023E2097A|nr:beta-1,4-galactosyltransferase 3-like isoform X1 [Pongo pygmaeus]